MLTSIFLHASSNYVFSIARVCKLPSIESNYSFSLQALTTNDRISSTSWTKKISSTEAHIMSRKKTLRTKFQRYPRQECCISQDSRSKSHAKDSYDPKWENRWVTKSKKMIKVNARQLEYLEVEYPVDVELRIVAKSTRLCRWDRNDAAKQVTHAQSPYITVRACKLFNSLAYPEAPFPPQLLSLALSLLHPLHRPLIFCLLVSLHAHDKHTVVDTTMCTSSWTAHIRRSPEIF